jgi:hypothetical protein
MAIDWTQVGKDVEAAVINVLKGSWSTVSTAAGPQIQAMISVGQSIDQSNNQGRLTPLEYNTLKSMQKRALGGILSAYEAVGIVVAEQAADAAWDVISQALVKGAGIAFA